MSEGLRPPKWRLGERPEAPRSPGSPGSRSSFPPAGGGCPPQGSSGRSGPARRWGSRASGVWGARRGPAPRRPACARGRLSAGGYRGGTGPCCRACAAAEAPAWRGGRVSFPGRRAPPALVPLLRSPLFLCRAPGGRRPRRGGPETARARRRVAVRAVPPGCSAGRRPWPFLSPPLPRGAVSALSRVGRVSGRLTGLGALAFPPAHLRGRLAARRGAPFAGGKRKRRWARPPARLSGAGAAWCVLRSWACDLRSDVATR